jgi:hypothetical protein
MEAEETILPFSLPRTRVPLATQVRSTLLVSSQQSLRVRGYFDRYLELVDDTYRSALHGLVAGVWLPIAVGSAHYEACERLALPQETLLAIGSDVQTRLAASILLSMARVAREAGFTPLTMLSSSQKYWTRVFHGSEVALFRLGPKDARFEIAGFPFASLTYNRVTFRGILASLVSPLCTRLFVRDAPEAAGKSSIGWRLSWV